jgi:predicted flap endonuclease-1-like 5' DNA nuclease
MTRFLKPRALYLAGLGLLAVATVDLMRRLRRSDGGEAPATPAAPTAPRTATAPAAKPQTALQTVPDAPTKAVVKAEPQTKAVGGDDLTQIKGIGPTYAQRLKDAGLTTYTDIANATADQLRDIARATRADPADWISQARSLNGH